VIRAVQTFDEIYVLTGGGPGSATKMIVHYIYETGFAVMPRNYGLAAAASLLLGLVLFGFTALQMAPRAGEGAMLSVLHAASAVASGRLDGLAHLRLPRPGRDRHAGARSVGGDLVVQGEGNLTEFPPTLLPKSFESVKVRAIPGR
jgi:hypothetical protein